MVSFSLHALRPPTVITTKLIKLLSPLFNQNSSHKMNIQPNTKRPTCPNCSKPLPLCLCVRIRTPGITNKVFITILQHKLEAKHPLNSARIVKLGLKNVELVTVCDVFEDAQFVVGAMGECTPSVCGNACESFEVGMRRCLGKRSWERCFDLGSEVDEKALVREQEEVRITVGKNGEIKSIHDSWNTHQDEGTTTPSSYDHNHIIASFKASKFPETGFKVQKFQNQQNQTKTDPKEFEINIPKGTVILFPTQDSVPIQSIPFEVKNMIVLDGTWAKANRMYRENPWLKVLPCVKLDMENVSLFSEVRRQPKPGCLSTIESVVYALKAVGDEDDFDGLGHLLDVFRSMVDDQRRCKDERVRKLSST